MEIGFGNDGEVSERVSGGGSKGHRNIDTRVQGQTHLVHVSGGAHVILELLPRSLVREVANVHAKVATVAPRSAAARCDVAAMPSPCQVSAIALPRARTPSSSPMFQADGSWELRQYI